MAATDNYIVDSWCAGAMDSVNDLMSKRDVTKLSTADVLQCLMKRFALDLRFDFMVKLVPLYEEIEAGFAKLGLHRDGDTWAKAKPAAHRPRKAPAHKPA